MGLAKSDNAAYQDLVNQMSLDLSQAFFAVSSFLRRRNQGLLPMQQPTIPSISGDLENEDNILTLLIFFLCNSLA